MNVALLTVDALRRDHVGFHGHDRDTTPFLDGFADGGLAAERAISPSGHTREAVPALLTGRPPHAAVDAGYRLATPSVATWLRDAGCATAAVHSNPYLSRAYGYDAGFDAFDDDLYLGDSKLLALAQRALDRLRGRHYAPGDAITDRALDWIDDIAGGTGAASGGDDWFLWAHYMDPHGPYAPPDEHARWGDGGDDPDGLYRRAAVGDPDAVTEDERRTMRDAYDGEIRYVDDCIERFVRGLEDRGLREKTLIVVTADHGDAFGEHGYYAHPRRLDDELLEVPLVVDGPGVEPGRLDGPVSTLAVASTVAAAADAPSASEGGDAADVDLRGGVPDGHVAYSSARGEGDEANLRRYRATAAVGDARLTVDGDGAVVASDGPEPLLERLRTHAEGGAGAGDVDGEPSGAVADRLEHLGYRE
mgnify:CR=1 FL=1